MLSPNRSQEIIEKERRSEFELLKENGETVSADRAAVAVFNNEIRQKVI